MLCNIYYMVFFLYPKGCDLHLSFMHRNTIFCKPALPIPLLGFMLLYPITITPTKRYTSLFFNLVHAIYIAQGYNQCIQCILCILWQCNSILNHFISHHFIDDTLLAYSNNPTSFLRCSILYMGYEILLSFIHASCVAFPAHYNVVIHLTSSSTTKSSYVSSCTAFLHTLNRI